MAWRSTLQASRRGRRRSIRTPHRTVHRHAVDLLELGQVLVQHLGAGLERRARRLVALVLAAPLAAHTCETLRVVHARAHRCMHAASVRPAASTHADAGAARSNSMAPLARGTPCCTTVARGCAAGEKAPAPAASASNALYMVPYWCFAMPNAERACRGRGVFGRGGAVRAANLRRCTSSYLCDASAIRSVRPPGLAACKTLGSGAFVAPQAGRELIDFARFGHCVAIAIAATFDRASDWHACAALVAETTHMLRALRA